MLLAIRAAMRVVTYVTKEITLPPPGEITSAQADSMRLVDGVLLGVENLLGLVTMIVFLVWIHRVLKATRASGRTTSISPGLAVGGWFIPLANLVLPWLSVRSALRALERPTVLAGVWWLVWLVNMWLTGVHQLARQLMLMPEVGAALPIEVLDRIFSLLGPTFWPYFLTDTAAWGLLALIVFTVRGAMGGSDRPA